MKKLSAGTAFLILMCFGLIMVIILVINNYFNEPADMEWMVEWSVDIEIFMAVGFVLWWAIAKIFSKKE